MRFIDAGGNLYIADQQDCVIRKVTASTGYISTVVGIPPSSGNTYCGYNGDGVSATTAELNEPAGLAVDAAGNLYIADFANYRVRMVTASTDNISTVAGNGTRGNSGSDGDGGLATSAQLWGAVGLAVDGVGDIYIADEFSDRIRKVAASSGNITTVAGTGTAGYNGDDISARSAELNVPLAVSVDPSGNLYIADDANNRIRMVTASSGAISTVAGGGTGCSQQTDNVGDDCPATSAELRSPGSVTMDASGNVYIADSGEARVRKVGSNASPTLILATSGTPSVYGGSVTFTTTLSGALTWNGSVAPSR
jgi:hypothetical protein